MKNFFHTIHVIIKYNCLIINKEIYEFYLVHTHWYTCRLSGRVNYSWWRVRFIHKLIIRNCGRCVGRLGIQFARVSNNKYYRQLNHFNSWSYSSFVDSVFLQTRRLRLFNYKNQITR